MTTRTVTLAMADLAAYLEREMKQQGWSLRRAAEAWGVDKSTLSLLLNNPDRTPDLKTLKKLAEGLGVSLARLIELTGFDLGQRDDPALYGLTEEERKILRGLSPQKRAALLRMIREMQEE